MIASLPNKLFKDALDDGDAKEALRALNLPKFLQSEVTYEDFKKAMAIGDLALVSRLLGRAQSGAYEFFTVKRQVAINNNEIVKIAAQNGHWKVVELLLKFKDVLDDITNDQNRALQLAIENGHLEIVNILLKIPAVQKHLIKTMSSKEDGILNKAIASGHLNVVERLLQIPSVQKYITINNNEILKISAKTGNTDIFLRLLQFSQEPIPSAIIKIAVENGHTQIVQILLNIPDVKKQLEDEIASGNNKSLQLAIQSGNLDILAQLYQLQGIESIIDPSLFMLAIQSDHPAVAVSLLQFNNVLSDPRNNQRAFLLAVEKGHTQIVKRLLKIPEILTTVADARNNALKLAVKGDHLKVVNLLLQCEAVINEMARKPNDNTILRLAVGGGHYKVVNRFLQKGTDGQYELPGVKETVDYALFQRAKNTEVIQRLLQKEAHDPSTFEFPDIARSYAVQQESSAAESEPLSMSEVAQSKENAMEEISPMEAHSFALLKKRYAEKLTKKGRERIFRDIAYFLISEYDKNPAKYYRISLPFEYSSFSPPGAKKEYYKNIYHTVYRYLILDNNPLISPDSEFSTRDARGRPIGASIGEAEKDMIACQWLAACDETVPLPEGWSREGMKGFLIKGMSLIARGHNWDKTRVKKDGPEKNMMMKRLIIPLVGLV